MSDYNSKEEKFIKLYKIIKEQAPNHIFLFKDPFWILIMTVISQRTKDEVTRDAAEKLYNKYKNVNGLSNANSKDVKKIIRKVGFSNVKSVRLIEISRYIKTELNGKIPEEHNLLMKIPGVGTKTANIVLTQAFKIPAIPVDIHVHRVFNRIGLVSTKSPEKTEEELKKIIPKEYQVEFNPVIVEFGKSICKPINPKCNICNIRKYCNYYKTTYLKNRDLNK